MAFRTNDTQQLSFYDTFFGLTEREQKALEYSWAKVFSEEVFPMINEQPFRVLFSTSQTKNRLNVSFWIPDISTPCIPHHSKNSLSATGPFQDFASAV